MAKLTLFDRIKFYRKKGIWLEEGEEMYDLMRLGINVYLDSKTSSAWIVEADDEGTKKITKISDEGKRALHFDIFDKKNGAIYFLGTEGIFCKSDKTEEMQKIYDSGKITGARVMPNFGVIILYQDSNDTIIQLSPNAGGIIEEIRCKVVHLTRPVTDEYQRKTFGFSKERRIAVKEMTGCYYSYTIGIQKSHLHKENKLEESDIAELLK